MARQVVGRGGEYYVVYSAMSCVLQASGSWDKTVRLWSPADSRCLFVLRGHGGWVQAVGFSTDGLFVASVGDHDVVRVWDCATGQCVHTIDVSKMLDASALPDLLCGWGFSHRKIQPHLPNVGL